MPLWDNISSWFTQNATHLQHPTFPDPNASVAVTTIKPQEHYFRLWLCEMFLTKSRNWFRDLYPAVNAQVRLKFGSDEKQPFTRVASPPQDQLGRGVYQNYPLTELLPFHGGTVEIQAGLLALKSESSLISAIKMLEGFSQLVTAPLGQALTLAGQVTIGVEKMFNGTGGQVHLGYHQTFAAAGGGGSNVLQPGYVAVIAATAAELPLAQLSVANGQLQRNEKGLEGFDYLLFRIEGRETRDDMPRNIEEPFQEAQAAGELGDADKARGFREAAIAAAFRSPDLTRADRRRVIDGIKKELQLEAGAAGHGLAGGEKLKLAQAVARHARNPADIAHLPEISSDEAFGE